MKKTTLNPFENAKRTREEGGGISPAIIEEMQEEISVLGSENASQAQDINDIKSKLQELAGAYSTTEHKTGRKWKDGKDIFEITIELNKTSIDTDSTVVATNINYVETLIDSLFTVQKANITGMERACAYISADKELKIHLIERWSEIVTSQITIQYTKPTV